MKFHQARLAPKQVTGSISVIIFSWRSRGHYDDVDFYSSHSAILWWHFLRKVDEAAMQGVSFSRKRKINKCKQTLSEIISECKS